MPIKSNVKLAPKLVNQSLQIFKKALVFVGQPFYLLLIYSVIGFLFLCSLIGKNVRLFFQTIINLFLSFFFLLKKFIDLKKKIKLPKIRIKKIQLRFPLIRIRLPKIKVVFPSIKIPAFEKRYLIIFCLFVSFCFFFWLLILKGLPKPKELITRDQEISTKIYDRNGVLLYKIYKDQNRSLIKLEDVPLHVRLATLAAEDAEFYTHPGFSIRGIVRSVYRNITRGELTGGSTITQQLVKNALLSSEKTLIRKLREVILAIQVEFVFSKDEILEMYLNEVSYGGTAYGIREATRVYFDKEVNQLSLAEAALLAGLPKSPTKYSPFGPNPEASLDRQKEILHLMVINHFISQEQAEKIEQEELVFAPNKTEIKAPHFVMNVKEQLEEKYGQEVVEKSGLEVTTTLDYSTQRLAEDVVKQEIARLEGLHVSNAAVLILNTKTGEILAMVGSKDYFDTQNDGNVNVVVRPRQPGSAIKVINYAYALSNGYTPATILSDTPVSFSLPGQEPYTPKNYDDQYRGKISLRNALAESRNIPAVKVLASYGVNKMIDLGRKMGITTWIDSRNYGLSLTLGGGEVKLLDLATVYATVANYGQKPKVSSVLKVTNYQGRVLEEKKDSCLKADCQKETIIDPRVAFLLIDILKDNQARSPAFGTHSSLVIPNHPEVAVKTGTSNNLRDNWTIGFNQDYLVAVWVGNNDNSPMSRIASGITGASPIWNKIMVSLLTEKESQEWPTPEKLVQIPICSFTGTLPCNNCPSKMEWFLEENQPQTACQPNQIITGQILPEAASTTQ